MATFRFDVNTQGIIHLTARLERINKYSFPAAVRATLTDCAMEMKQKNILESAKRNMKVKQPNFFKANTGVERARFNRNIEAMSATSGFINKRGVKAGKAVNYGMEANEVGDTDSTGMMYKKATRSGRGLVRRNKYYDRGKLTKSRAKKKGNAYVQSAFASFKDKKPVMVDTKSGRAMIMVKSITSSKGKLRIKSDLLMLDRTVKKANAKASHFNREAAQKTQKQIEGFYQKNANFQFSKIWR
jgi:hypothetical protein